LEIDKAVATGQKLLDTNPNYEGKTKYRNSWHSRKSTRESNRGRPQNRSRDTRNHEQSKTRLPGKNPAGFSVARELAQPAARPALRRLSWPVGFLPNVLSGPEKFSGALLRKVHAWRDAVSQRVRLSPRRGSVFREPK
jgi:hypothetical protein